MSITAGVANSLKQEVLQGVHDFDSDTFKIALYGSAATIGPTTTAYTATGEVTGAGYTAGGVALTGFTLALDSGVAHVDFTDPSWSGATITARGALIYNSSKSDRAVGVIDFGEDISAVNETFRVTAPAPGATTGAIRFA